MRIANRSKRPGQGRTYVKNDRRIPINLDLSSLSLICNFVVSENRNVRRSQYVNIRNMIEMLDMDKYKNDPEKNKRIVFIRKVLEARLDRNLQDKDMVIKYANGGILDNDFIDVSTFRDLSNSEIDWVNETV